MRRLVVVSSILLPTILATASATAQEPPVHFSSTDVVTISAEPTVATLVNDSVDTYKVICVTAEVTPDALPIDGSAPKSHAVDVAFEINGSFQPSGRAVKATLPPGGTLRLKLTLPKPPPPASSGWLTVIVGRSTTPELVTRQRLSVPAAQVATGLSSWSFESMSRDPTPSGGAQTLLPLSKGSCADAGAVNGVLVDGDRKASVTSGACRPGQTTIPLNVTGISDVGKYSGTVKIGSENITVTVTRTLWWIWPVLAILAGVVLALVAQGSTDRGWAREENRWLGQLKKDGENADKAFIRAAADATWKGYRIKDAVTAEVERLRTIRNSILKERGRWRRYLPWPANFMSAERSALRDGTARVDQMSRRWHTTPDQFKALQAATGLPELDTVAPGLGRRRDALLAGTASLDDIDDIEHVITELDAWPNAEEVVRSVAKAKARLAEITPGATAMVASDKDVFDAAVRSTRALSGALSTESNAKVVADLAPKVTALTNRISELPMITISEVAPAETVTTETVQPETALAIPRTVRAAAAFLASRGDTLLNLVMVGLTVAVALWTGLTTLYIGKAWGTWVDFVAAVAWGFGTAAVLTPIITALRQWGTRITDPAGET
jgi:hypothetical protein